MEQTDVSWLIGNPVFGVVAGILLTALGGYGTLVGKMVLVRGSMIAAWTIVVLSFAFYPVNAPPMHRFVIGALVGFMWGAILVWVDLVRISEFPAGEVDPYFTISFSCDRYSF